METKITSHIIKGITIAAVLMLIHFIIQKQGGKWPQGAEYVPTILLPVGIMVSCLIFNRQSGGNLPFGTIFAHGFKTTAVVAFLMAAYTFIMIKFVYPPPGEHDIQLMMKSIMQQEKNMMPQEARKSAEEMVKKGWIFAVSGAIFASVISGLVGSLIGATLANTAIAKKKS